MTWCQQFAKASSTVKKEAEASVIAALSKLPAAHVKHVNQITKNGVKFAPIKDMGPVDKWANMPVGMRFFGAFDPRSKIVVVPEKVAGQVIPKEVNIGGSSMFVFEQGPPEAISHAMRVRIMYHEAAHALDARGVLSSRLAKTMAQDLKTANPEVVREITRYLNASYGPQTHNLEMFAEVYTAKYLKQTVDGVPYLGGLNHVGMSQAFPRTMAAMDKMDVSSRGFVSSLLPKGMRQAREQRLTREFIERSTVPPSEALEDVLRRIT